jgi:TonB family protein
MWANIMRTTGRLREIPMKLHLAMFAVVLSFALVSVAATQNPQLSVNDPIILSDTHGYNFEKYLGQLTQEVRTKWYSGVPDSARQGQKGRVVLIFTVLRDGTSQGVRIVAGSGTESLDQAATAAVQSASPLPQLPADFSDDRIVVQFAFLYNLR